MTSSFISGMLSYSILQNETNCVTVDSIVSGFPEQTYSTISIPGQVTYNDILYDVTEISNSFMRFNGSVKKLTMADSIKKIGQLAFASSNVNQITLSQSLTSLPNALFQNCRSLKSLVYNPDSITSIGSYCFSYCDNLIMNILFNNVETLGSYAFDRCSNAEYVYLNDELTSIPDACFAGCTSFTNVSLPRNLTSLGAQAFSDCYQMVECNIPETLLSFGSGCFSGNPNLKRIVITKNITNIPSRCFLNCQSLEDVVFNVEPNGAFIFNESCFSGCTSLNNMLVPNNTTSFKQNSFKGATINNMVFPYGVIEFANGSFESAKIKNLNAYINPATINLAVSWYAFVNFNNRGSDQNYNIKVYGTNLDFFNPNGPCRTFKNNCYVGYPSANASVNSFIQTYVTGKTTIDLDNNVSTMAIPTISTNTTVTPTITVSNINIASISNGQIALTGNTGEFSIKYYFRNSRSYSQYDYTIKVIIRRIARAEYNSVIPNLSIGGRYEFTNLSSDVSVAVSNTVVGSISANTLTGKNIGSTYAIISVGSGVDEYSSTIPKYLPFFVIGNYGIINGSFSVGKINYVQSPLYNNAVIAQSLKSGLSDEELSTITIPETIMYGLRPYNVIEVGQNFIQNNSKVHILNIGVGITKISNNACNSATGLLSVNLPTSLISIGESAFSNCVSLNAINLPNSVQSLGINCFSACSNLALVSLSTSLTKLPASCFQQATALTGIVIPSSVTNIETSCFNSCSNLASVSMTNNIETIGSSAFSRCEKIVNISLPIKVTKLSSGLFNACNALKNVAFNSANITEIGAACFFNCENLELALDFPKITLLGQNAFSGCKKVTYIYLNNDLLSISNGAFANCIAFTEVTLPTKLKILENSVFSTCTNMRKCKLPNTLESMGEYCFDQCSNLLEVFIPHNVAVIRKRTFYRCQSLNLVEFNVNQNTSFIFEEDAFAYCTSLVDMYLPANTIRIDNNCFQGAVISGTMVLPNTITTFGYRTNLPIGGAFYQATVINLIFYTNPNTISQAIHAYSFMHFNLLGNYQKNPACVLTVYGTTRAILNTSSNYTQFNTYVVNACYFPEKVFVPDSIIPYSPLVRINPTVGDLIVQPLTYTPNMVITLSHPTTNSNGGKTFVSLTTNICTFSTTNNRSLSIYAAGTANVEYRTAGTTIYLPSVTRYTLHISKAFPSYTSVPQNTTLPYGTTANIRFPKSNSTGTWTAVSSNASICSISNVTTTSFTLNSLYPGSVDIIMTQSSTTNYEQGRVRFTATLVKANTFISGISIASTIDYRNDLSLPLVNIISGVSSNNSSSISYSITDSNGSASNIASIDEATQTIYITDIGEFVFRVSQAETDTHNSVSKPYNVSVGKGTPLIEDIPDRNYTYGDEAFNINFPDSPSNGEWSILGISNHNIINIVEGYRTLFEILKAGTTTITIRQASTSKWNAVTKHITVNVAKQDPVFDWSDYDPNISFGDQPSAIMEPDTTNTDTNVSFSYATDNTRISYVIDIIDNYGQKIASIVNRDVGQVILTATCLETDNFNSASVNKTFNINKGTPQVYNFILPSTLVYSQDLNIQLPNITSNSNGLYSYSVDDTSIATIDNNNKLIILKPGTINLILIIEPTNRYNGTTIETLITILKTPATITSFTTPRFILEGETMQLSTQPRTNVISDSNLEFVYNSLNDSIVDITNGYYYTNNVYLHGVDVGNTDITVTLEESDFYTSATKTNPIRCNPDEPGYNSTPLTLGYNQTVVSFLANQNTRTAEIPDNTSLPSGTGLASSNPNQNLVATSSDVKLTQAYLQEA